MAFYMDYRAAHMPDHGRPFPATGPDYRLPTWDSLPLEELKKLIADPGRLGGSGTVKIR
jgi:hypothetical protein